MFEDATFESMGRIQTRSRRWMIAVTFFNTSILAAMILFPLFYPEALPPHISAFLVQVPPPPPPAPTIPDKPIAQAPQPAAAAPFDPYTAPTRIPHIIIIPSEPEVAMPVNPATWALNTADSNSNLFSNQRSVTVARAEQKPMRVPTTVEEGLLIQKIMPIYPPIARAARIEGTVRLVATISKTGNIENLHVASGQPMLQQAALEAVSKWRYRPYLLDGQPVEVETTVDVIFMLGR
jgi:protein TonB